jgi:hypothetical protein
VDVRKNVLAAVIVIVASIVTAGRCGAGQSEYRGRMEMVGPLERNVSLKLLTEVRSRNDLHTHNESHFDIGLEWKLRQWLAVGPCYRHVTEEKSGVWRVEQRPHLDVTLGWRSGWVSLYNRNRLEYRMMEGRQAFRFRQRLMLRVSSKSLPGIQPHVSEESFYDLDTGKINKNRFTAGVDVKVLSSVRLGADYVLDSTRAAGHWRDLNAITIAIKYRPQ